MKKFVLLLASIFVTAALCSAAEVDTVLIETTNIASPAKAVVITPDHAEGDLFPTVYMLNGYTGDYTSWCKLRPDLDSLAEVYQIVIVMPDGRDSWYWDTDEMKMETFFIEDLVPYIDKHFPTYQDGKLRAITGLSMGGHGALWLSLRHPDVWNNAGSMSGGVDIRPFSTRWRIKQLIGTYQDNPSKWDAMTVAGIPTSTIPQSMNITIDCGVDDFFIEVNRSLHNAWVTAKIPHDYTERPGAHTGKYWANSIIYHLQFFRNAFNAAQKP